MAEKEGEQTWVKPGEWTAATSKRALSVMHPEHVFGGELGTSKNSNYDHRLCQQPDLNLKPSIPLNWLCSLGKLPYCISNTSFCKMDTEHLYKMGLRIYHKVYITLNGLEYS